MLSGAIGPRPASQAFPRNRGGAGKGRRPPNILLIVIDDLGWRDLGLLTPGVFETPRIDALAAEGTRFSHAYANCPVCSPSRAALMTGKDPARLRFTGHITATGRHRYPETGRIIPPDDRMRLPLGETTLAEALKPAGYVSASVGKWHLGPEGDWPGDQGFDLNIGGWTHGSPPDYFYPYTNPEKAWNPSIPTLQGGEPGEYLTDRLTDEAIGFIERNRDRPFFLYLAHYAVHTPLQAPAGLVDKYRRKLAGRGSGVDPVYAAMVENADANVGRVLDTLDRLDLAEDTMVILYSDNGGLQTATNNAPLREGKGWLYEGGVRVPLIIRWPGRAAAGAVCAEPVVGTDIFPTVAEAAGAGTEGPLDGTSLAPLLEGGGSLNREALYWYYPHYSPQALQPGAAVLRDGFKLIEFYDPPRTELYCLRDDPGERSDLAGAMPAAAAEMRGMIREYLARVDAKLHTTNPAR